MVTQDLFQLSRRNEKPMNLLDRELIFTDRPAVDKLYRTPQTMKLIALIDVQDPVARGYPMPDGVIQIGFDPGENNLKHRQSAAQPLTCQQIPLGGYIRLLK